MTTLEYLKNKIISCFDVACIDCNFKKDLVCTFPNYDNLFMNERKARKYKFLEK